MTDQRLMEEVLENMRALRFGETETKVKLAEISGQLQNLNSMRSDFEKAQREIADHDLRLAGLEGQKLDGRLKKVEGLVFKIVTVSLMLVGGMEFMAKLVEVAKRVGL